MSEKAKFKKDQRVVAIDDFEDGRKGEHFVIVDPDDPEIGDYVVLVHREGSSYRIAQHRTLFVPATKTVRFEVGDRVRAIDNDPSSLIEEGTVYTIWEADDPETDDYYVTLKELRFKGEFNPHRSLLVLVDEDEED